MKPPKKPRVKKEPIIYNGVQYDSDFEVLFAMFVREAEAYGYIEKAEYHPVSIVLSEPVFYPCLKQDSKGKYKQSREEYFGKVVYTLDWRILWTHKALQSGLIQMLGNNRRRSETPLIAQRNKNNQPISFIDVKPPVKAGGHNASYRDFAIKAPLIFAKTGMFCQSLVPINAKKIEDCFFSKAWAPKEYLFRPRKDGKGYYINYCKQITIDDYERTKKMVQSDDRKTPGL
jgi:hypothetical protein